MTFTYTPSVPDNLTRVRFHIGDTDSSNALFQDDEVNFAISESGGWQTAVIWLLENLVAKLTQERDFRADWMSQTSSTMLASFQDLLLRKRREFGIPQIVGTSKHVYRPDSGQSGPPDFTGVQSGQYNDYDTAYPLGWPF